jgi:hypothetical protein
MSERLLLVEGESDRVAVQTLARRLGLDLGSIGVSVVAMGGVTNLGRHLATAEGADVVAVLHDIGETAHVERAVGRVSGRRPARFVCDRDLEDELIRSLGVPRTVEVIETVGDLGKWRTLIGQPFHRQRPEHLVLRRFFGTTSGRKARYARLLVDALDLDRIPRPLAGALAAVTPTSPAGQASTQACVTDALPRSQES